MKVLTIGHSTLQILEFVALLQAHGVQRLVDVRAIPRSRTNPQYNLDALPGELNAASITHTHMPNLGGRRSSRPDLPRSLNPGWRNTSFRNYADYALTAPFIAALDRLQQLAALEQVAIMCAESLWWRCHRRIIADYLLSRGVRVAHIMGAADPTPHQLTALAVPQADGTILYPEQQQAMIFEEG